MNDICHYICPCSQCNAEEEDCELAKAYQIQISKKPVRMPKEGYSFERFECPTCNKYIIGFYNKCCQECGQKLYWEGV